MTFSFSEYVSAESRFRVSGTVDVYFRDDALLAEMLANADELAAACASPRTETAVGRFLPADMVVAA